MSKPVWTEETIILRGEEPKAAQRDGRTTIDGVMIWLFFNAESCKGWSVYVEEPCRELRTLGLPASASLGTAQAKALRIVADAVAEKARTVFDSAIALEAAAKASETEDAA